LLAGVIGAGLVVFFGLVLMSSNTGLVSGDNRAVCDSRGDNSVVDDSHGDTHNLCSRKSFSILPADYAAFEAWLRAQPGVQTVEIRRVGDSALALRLEYVRSGRDNPQWLLSPPWDQLGYQPAPGVSPSILGGPLPPLNG
jgi:hypothetical protein